MKTADRYDIKWKNGWAVVFITEDGLFSAISDYGNYGYYWASPGMPFKEFVIGLEKDPGYMLSKIGGKMKIDEGATVKNIREDVLKARKSGSIDEESARKCMDEIDNHLYGTSGEEFCRELENCEELIKVYDGDLSSIPINHEYSGQAQGFVKEVMPRLAEILRKELENDRLVG